MLARWRYRRQCRVSSQRCSQSSLTSCIEESAVLKVDRLVDTPMIAVDLEMTGLDARQNQIIAIGWTYVNNGRVQFGANNHLLINAAQSVGSSAAIHQLMDHEVASGVSLETGLEALFEAAKGRLWLFHHASLDVAFLKRACETWAGVQVPFMALDTMQMERRTRHRRNLPLQAGDLQLGRLREHYHLPQQTAHNALMDACATAELLLAMAAHMDPVESIKLGPHLNFF